MSRVITLFSGSTGNSTYIGYGTNGLLIDVGVSARALVNQLNALDIAIENIKAIFLTHEHIDHIMGVKVLAAKYKIKVYATKGTLDYLIKKDKIKADTEIKILETGKNYTENDLEISPFSTSHDASESCGYRFKLPDGRIVGVCTDLGYVDIGVRDALTGCDMVVIESNHDVMMLKSSRYPYILKQRILGSTGHISNEDCARELVALIKSGTTRIALAHLSRENNYEELALATARSVINEDVSINKNDYILKCSKIHTPQAFLL